MDLNLTQLAIECRKLFRTSHQEFPIEFFLCSDGSIKATMGETVFFFDYARMMNALQLNKVSFRVENEAYQLYARYVVNNLRAAIGKKIYPEVIALEGEY